MRRRLLLLSFVEGGAVMAAELCGAKLLAPVFGNSLYVWASVMGITLAALAFGYFFGGWLSGKDKRVITLFRILSVAALFLLLMPILDRYVVPRISYLPFLPGVVLSTFLLLFPPVFFLGASSPLFILLQTDRFEKAGKVSGTVYAVSTFGGILSTFLCGFYLIPDLGLNTCLIIFGILLFASTVITFKIFKPSLFFLLLAFAYLNLQSNIVSGTRLMSSDSVLGHLEVQDLNGGDKDGYRILTINDIVQTEIELSSHRSRSQYVKLIDSLLTFSPRPKRALLLGLGGGPVANLLEEKNYRTDGVEFDPRVILAAQKYFYLNPSVQTYCEDARYFVNHCDSIYDLLVVDVFRGEEQPSHVLTRESLLKLKQNLDDSAWILINWHGFIQGEMGKGTVILYNTLAKAGFYVKICSHSKDEHHRNLLFVASQKPLAHLPFELSELPDSTTLINSDDSPLLEKYNAKANKAWRLSYLRYYQGLR